MNSDWRQVSIKQVCERITSGGTPRSTEHAYYEGGTIPWLTTSEVNYNIVRETERHITPLGLENSAAKVVPQDTVIVAMYGRGTAGRVAMAGKPLTTNQACCNLIIDRTIANPRYVFYALWHDFARLDSLATGSVQQNLSARVISDFEIALPPLREQDAIASILGALDDKIELNRRMSNTLEEIGRTLFRAWFIDFTAKPSSGSSTSTKGKSPPDWHLGTIGDLVERRTQRIGDASATVLSAIAEGALVRSEDNFKKRVHSKSISKYIAVHQWDFAYNPSRINIGSIGLHEESFLGAVSPVYIVARPKPEYRWFLRFFLLEESTKEWIRTLSSGSVRQSLSFDAFASIPCIIPRPPDMETFNDTWKKLWSAIRLRELESATLSQIRDTLLPRLISGELRVHEAEQFVSEVV